MRAAALFILFMSFAAGTASAKTLYSTIVYDEKSGSYFELIRAGPNDSLRGPNNRAISWENARKKASARVYKGVRGRLAVVKSREVNDFLAKTFDPEHEAWIGLRYMCHERVLQWVTGDLHPRSAYSRWARPWNRVGSTVGQYKVPTCNKTFRYWPVHYWSRRRGFRWNAHGQFKEMRSYFVEYPLAKKN